MHPVQKMRRATQPNVGGQALLERMAAASGPLRYTGHGLPDACDCVVKVWYAAYLGDPTWRPETERCHSESLHSVADAEAWANAWAAEHPRDTIRCTVQDWTIEDGRPRLVETIFLRRHGCDEPVRTKRGRR